MKRFGPDEKSTIMVRLTCDDEVYLKFKELIKPLTVSDALGIMVASAVDSNTKPFAVVIEGLLRGVLRGEKEGTLFNNIETFVENKSTPTFAGDVRTQKGAKKKR